MINHVNSESGENVFTHVVSTHKNLFFLVITTRMFLHDYNAKRI